MFGGHSRSIDTPSHDALRKKLALVRSVTSLTGAFAGNFVDFQWDFFTLQALAVIQAIIAVSSLGPNAKCPITKVTLTQLGIFSAYGYTCLR